MTLASRVRAWWEQNVVATAPEGSAPQSRLDLLDTRPVEILDRDAEPVHRQRVDLETARARQGSII